MGYTVTYYQADGHTVRLTKTVMVPNLRAARAYIRAQIGGRSLGTWTDDEGNECWHASRALGCGCYCIERQD